jgi:hypothetical protein
MVAWRDRLLSSPEEISGCLFRLVESQEQVATSHLVKSLDRQAVLEEMLESTKPALPEFTAGFHYLLATPFRYPPLKYGSRFGSRKEPSLFYGSKKIDTALAETAYYRFVFWHGMAVAPDKKLDTQHTLFDVSYKTQKGIRLQLPPFDVYSTELTHLSDYMMTQALGSLMRGSGVDVFEFYSARDPNKGINVGLFSTAGFASRNPAHQEPWICELTASQVFFRSAREKGVTGFSLESFFVDGRLPIPA